VSQVTSEPLIDTVAGVLNEIQRGGGLSLAAAGRLFPAHRGAGSVSPSTVFRWARKGLKSPDGRLVRLEAVRVGARWLTSRAAVTRFVAALTAGADPTDSEAPRSPVCRTRASEAAEKELRRLGV
jgi:hypothetical protein